MENILLFVLTVFLCSMVWYAVCAPALWVGHIKRVALIALLDLPVNIDGNVFTIAGNATAEKSVYSIFSLYQKAGQDAVTLVGLAGYQQAETKAYVPVAIALYQRTGKKTRAFGAFSTLSKD